MSGGIAEQLGEKTKCGHMGCNKVFQTQWHKQRHEKSTKHFCKDCPVCDSDGYNQREMQHFLCRHQRCGRSFKTRSGRIKHEKTIHTCEDCIKCGGASSPDLVQYDINYDSLIQQNENVLQVPQSTGITRGAERETSERPEAEPPSAYDLDLLNKSSSIFKSLNLNNEIYHALLIKEIFGISDELWPLFMVMNNINHSLCDKKRKEKVE